MLTFEMMPSWYWLSLLTSGCWLEYLWPPFLPPFSGGCCTCIQGMTPVFSVPLPTLWCNPHKRCGHTPTIRGCDYQLAWKHLKSKQKMFMLKWWSLQLKTSSSSKHFYWNKEPLVERKINQWFFCTLQDNTRSNPGFKIQRIAAGCFHPICRWLFTEEIENVMLWLAHWNQSCRNVVVNIAYQALKQQRNVLKPFWQRFKMSWKSRKRFGNLKCATKVEREDSCSLRTTNFILLHSKRQNYREQMCSLRVTRIWNHQPLLNTYKAN